MNNISIKSDDQIKKMIIAGKLASEVLEMIEEYVKPGIKTVELDLICHKYIVDDQYAIPAPLNYHGFPASTCISVNNVVCHGVPSDKVLKKGDIVNIDITVIKDGYHGDTSKMFIVGKASVKAQKLCRITQECLYAGIRTIKPGALFSDIGDVIEPIARKNNYSIVRAYCGHGIGLGFHEPPQVYHHSNTNSNMVMDEGMIFTIEPMINIGSLEVNTSKFDGWTVTTKDRSLSAQWEHTILVTANGYQILTLRNEELGNI
jgi:methionyl aminopeptidase